ncbi:MAG: efflux RND transporter periplasmic adaptor subunit [Betaproteobacteria bacterium]|nr:efflux RND transporter periplasmic adaptor subunit [Betaproteobacteria bacterium]
MKQSIAYALAALGLVGAGIVVGQRLGHTPAGPESTGAAAPAPAEKKPLYWRDPMYPQHRFDQPGKSPFMDMMLVPVYAEDGAAPQGVTIDPRMAQNLGIRTAGVERGTLQRSLRLAGNVTFDERAVALVQARVSGYVERLFVRAPLDRVRQGEPLAELLAPEWVAAQEEYLALRRAPQAGPGLREAARQRLALLGMSETTIAAIEADGQPRPRITLTAPLAGVVTELAVREGSTVMAGTPLFRINGLSTVWVLADVPEAQAGWLKPGTAVAIGVPAYPGESLTGRVGALLPDVNPGTRTLKARIEVPNARGRLAPGMFANIVADTRDGTSALLVPTEAVIATGKRTVVIVAVAGSPGRLHFTPTDIDIGSEANGMTEVLRGLDAGARVVLSGQFLIDSEASLKASATRMAPATHGTGAHP